MFWITIKMLLRKKRYIVITSHPALTIPKNLYLCTDKKEILKQMTEKLIRRANKNDIAQILNLLLQGDMVHFKIRPDIFKPNTTKYNEQELSEMLNDDSKPIFVYDDGGVLGYLFCQITEIRNNSLLQDIKTLYIDDLCVDESARGKHIGKTLFDFVQNYAQSIGCHNITLNAWEGNDTALSFYRNMGMKPQKTCMELVLK